MTRLDAKTGVTETRGRAMKRFLFAAFLAAALFLSAVLCSSASTSTTNSGWAGKHRFTVVAYSQNPPSIGGSRGTALVMINKHIRFCELLFSRDHHLSRGTVFTDFITDYFKVVNSAGKRVHSCIYSERDDMHAPKKAVGHVSTVTVRSVIQNAGVESALALRPPNKYYFVSNDPNAGGFQRGISYTARAAKAVHRAEDSGKAVTVRVKILENGRWRHLGFVR